MRPRERTVHWSATTDAEFPHRATVDGAPWTLRLNDFPAEEMYTLIIDGEEIESFSTWPAAWTADDADDHARWMEAINHETEWTATGDATFPYEVHHAVSNVRWRLRRNSARPEWTLVADEKEIVSFTVEEWPSQWRLPLTKAE